MSESRVCPSCGSDRLSRDWASNDEDEIVYSSFDLEYKCRECGYSVIIPFAEDDEA